MTIKIEDNISDIVAVGTSNSIYYVAHYVLKDRNVKMETEKGY